MRYRPLGNSGLTVSVVGLGCNNFGARVDLDGTRAVVDAALDAGITLLDTADVYGNMGGSETLLGEVLKGRRDQVVIATKFGHRSADMGYGPAAGAKGGRNYIRRAVEESLRRLKTDYIDLYQMHTPDSATPIDETLTALDELVTSGKVRYLGSSNFTGWQIAEADHTARQLGTERFISAQNHWSIIDRAAETEVVPAARHYGIGVLPYFPLASGLLTGKIRKGAQQAPEGSRLARIKQDWSDDPRLDTVEALIAFAERHGYNILDVAVGALAAQPGCGSVIAGATSAEQVRANAAAGTYEPSPEQLSELNTITSPPAA